MKNLSRMITDMKKHIIAGSVGRFKKCSMPGKVTALVGLFGILVTLYLILFQTSDLRIVQSDFLVISASSANIRSNPSLQASVESKASRGTELTPLQTRGDWSNVRIDGTSKTGWVHKSVVKKEQLSKLVRTYQLYYYALLLVLAVVLLGTGLSMREGTKAKNLLSQLQRYSKAQLQRYSKANTPRANAPTVKAPDAKITEKSPS